MNRRLATALPILIVSALLWIVPVGSRAQSVPSDSTNLIVRHINFHGNKHVSSKTLKQLIQTHTNRDFFGIPGFTLFYYIWQLTNHTFGEKPVLLNYETAANDMHRITRYYHSIGYLNASTDTSFVTYGKHKRKVKVNFYIKEGKRSYIKSIAYSGIPDSAFKNQQQKINFYKASPLTQQQINDSTFKADVPYSNLELNNERKRIIDYLNNHGYAVATLDSVTAYAKRDKKNKQFLHLLYKVNAGKKYKFGNLHISLAGPGHGNDTTFTYQQRDTLDKSPYTLNGQKIIMQKQRSAHSRFSLLTDQILFKPGATFSKKRYNKSLNSFQNLGMLTVLNFGLYKGGDKADSIKSGDVIPLYFKLQTRPRNKIGFDVFGMRRYGFGSGGGITYSNNNLFGKAENLQLSANGSFEYVRGKRLNKIRSVFQNPGGIQTRSTFYRSFEAQAALTLPRLIWPFAWLDKYLAFSNSSTRFSLSYKKADRVLFNIDSDLKFDLQDQVHHNKHLTSILDLLQLELLDTHPTKPFVQSIDTVFQNDPLALQQVLEDFRPQFSSLVRYTLRDVNTDLIERNYGHFSAYSVGVGGTVPYLIDRFVVTPGTVEGNIPSPVRFSQNSLAYSQYVKTTADYRRYFPLSPNTVFAVRGFGGYAVTFGKRKTIPLNQRFYAGGSNDIRGWSLFTLGPGDIPFNKVVISGGQIKLLGQMELRDTFLKHFLSSNWIFALFVDAGNVWYGPDEQPVNVNQQIGNSSGNPLQNKPINLSQGRFKLNQFYKQIAVGSGVGIRLDLNYLILRFDLAFRLHDLQTGWFGRNSKFLHFDFGIGQSF